MQDPTEATRSPLIANQSEAIVPSIITIFGGAAVNHNREFCVLSNLHLLVEDALLHVARGVIVKIIEPDLPDRYDLGSLQKLRHPIIGRLASELRLVWMDTDGRVNELVLLG